MDTVTETQMAIQLALQGGLGINTYICRAKQSNMIREVKRYNNGFINNPCRMSNHHYIRFRRYY